MTESREPEPVAATAPVAGVADADHRLHPMSWLFVLLAQLRQFILPLLALLVFGQGSSDDVGGNGLWPLIGVAALALLSLWQYFTYRYGMAVDALVVRSGVLERSVRVIPFARIHNVALKQTLLHRLFGVAEVRLESAGGTKPEAEMRVLKLGDALALERLVRQRGPAPDAGVTSTAADHDAVLLQMPLGEVLRLGLVSNRGLILVAAAFGGVSQFNAELLPDLFERWGDMLFGWAGEHQFGVVEFALAAVTLALLVELLLGLLSIALALLQFHGFRLSEHGRRLTVERGLLARWRTSASRRRIQAWTLREGMRHRWLGRQSLEVDTAVSEDHNRHRALREVAPIATPAQCIGLIDHLLPHAQWTTLDWHRLPAGSWWRLWLPSWPWVLAATTVLTWNGGNWGLLVLAWLPWSAYKARRRTAHAAWALGDEVVAVREGWLRRQWRFAELDKLQALQLSRNPIDRRCGTATVWLDTAGAGAMAPPLRVRLLPLADAQALYVALSRELARRPLRW